MRCVGLGTVIRGVMVLTLWLVSSLVLASPRALFFNPGSADDSFWGDVDQLMQVAAISLEIDLTILHSERDHFKMIAQLNEQLNLTSPLPEYVILVNEKRSSMPMLQALRPYPIYVQLLLSDITPLERAHLLQDEHWQQYLLPPVVPNYQQIGADTARALVQQVSEGVSQGVMIAGDKSTPASQFRSLGAEQVFTNEPKVELTQVVYGHWNEAIAYEQTRVLLNRYPKLKLIWTASDQMASGAIRALTESQRRAGQDVFVATFNTSLNALHLRRTNQVSVLGGGHFLAGGLGLLQIQAHRQTGHYRQADKIQLFRILQPASRFFEMLEARQWQQMFQSEIVDVINQ